MNPILLACLLLILQQASNLCPAATADDTRDNSESWDPPSSEKNGLILEEYFRLSNLTVEGFSISGLYEDSDISRMSDLLVANRSPEELRSGIAWLNTMMYQNEKSKEQSDTLTDDKKAQVLLNTLEKIVPDSVEQRSNRKYKDELKQIVLERPAIHGELLRPFYVALMEEELSTVEAVEQLKMAYYHWIPLYRLSQLLKGY